MFYRTPNVTCFNNLRIIYVFEGEKTKPTKTRSSSSYKEENNIN